METFLENAVVIKTNNSESEDMLMFIRISEMSYYSFRRTIHKSCTVVHDEHGFTDDTGGFIPVFSRNPVSPPVLPAPPWMTRGIFMTRLFHVFVTCQDLERDLERSGRGWSCQLCQASFIPTNRTRNLRSVFVSRQLSCFVFVIIQTRSVKMEALTRKHSSRMRTTRLPTVPVIHNSAAHKNVDIDGTCKRSRMVRERYVGWTTSTPLM